jgi:hypothetical protein
MGGTQSMPKMPAMPVMPAMPAIPSMIPKNKFTDYEGMDKENFEPKWTKAISNRAICDWFYIFYLANVIIICLVIGVGLYALITKGHSKVFTSSNVFFALLHLIVSGTNMLFFFLICDRSLKPAA